MKKLLGIALVGVLATTAIGCGPKAGASGGTKVAPPADGTAPPPAGGAGTTTPADPSTSPAATPAPPG
jgi:hypothetical protein